MSVASDRPVSLHHAARVLFRARQPNANQVEQVARLMKSGALPADCRANRERWTTTEAALADFMANSQLTRQATATGAGEELRPVYRGILRDYFLAVMLRRRLAGRSVAFRRAVVAGQAVVFLLLFGLAGGSALKIRSRVTSPPERQAVEAWIAERTDAYAVERWAPTQRAPGSGGLLVEAAYRYRKDSPRWVHTQRRFLVAGQAVTELVEEDD